MSPRVTTTTGARSQERKATEDRVRQDQGPVCFNYHPCSDPPGSPKAPQELGQMLYASSENTHLSGRRTSQKLGSSSRLVAVLAARQSSFFTSNDADEKIQVDDGGGHGGGRHRQPSHQAARHDNGAASVAIDQDAAHRTCKHGEGTDR